MSSLSLVEQKAVLVYEETAEVCCALLSRNALQHLWHYPDFSAMQALVDYSLGAWADKLPAGYFSSAFPRWQHLYRQYHADACATCGSVFADTYGGRLRETCPNCTESWTVPKNYINIYWHLWMLSQTLTISPQHLAILTANAIRRRHQLGLA